jgi:hypothetical protein
VSTTGPAVWREVARTRKSARAAHKARSAASVCRSRLPPPPPPSPGVERAETTTFAVELTEPEVPLQLNVN